MFNQGWMKCPRRVSFGGRMVWAASTTHKCCTCLIEKERLRSAFQACTDPERAKKARQAWTKKTYRFRAMSPNVLRHYAADFPWIVEQMQWVENHHSAISLECAQLADSLIVSGLSPERVADIFAEVRARHRTSLLMTHTSFIESASVRKSSVPLMFQRQVMSLCYTFIYE